MPGGNLGNCSAFGTDDSAGRLAVEYRVVSLYSRDAGKREARIGFNVGQGTQDLGFRNELNVLFDCEPGVEVVLDIIDDDGEMIGRVAV